MVDKTSSLFEDTRWVRGGVRGAERSFHALSLLSRRWPFLQIYISLCWVSFGEVEGVQSPC